MEKKIVLGAGALTQAKRRNEGNNVIQNVTTNLRATKKGVLDRRDQNGSICRSMYKGS